MRAVGVAIVMALAILVLGAAGVPATTYARGDFLQFWLEPRALLAGMSPYDTSWWAAMHRDLGVVPLFDAAVYPPYDAIAFLPIGVLPLAYAAAAWLVGQVTAALLVSAALARRLADPRDGRLFVAIAVAFQPAWLLAVGGNMGGWLFALVGMAYLAASRARPLWAGAWLGLLAIKPHPFAFLAMAVIVAATPRERGRVVLGTLATAGTLAALILVLHPSWYAEWIPFAFGLQSTTGSNATAWTIGRVVGIDGVVPGLVVAGVLALVYAVWARAARPDLALAIAAATPVSLALAPHGWSYDQLALLVPIALVLGRIGELERPRRVLTAAFALACVVVPWLLYAIAFRRAGEELSVLTPAAVFAAIALVMPRTGHPKMPSTLVASRA